MAHATRLKRGRSNRCLRAWPGSAIFGLVLFGGAAAAGGGMPPAAHAADEVSAKASELLAEARSLAGEDLPARAITCALAALELDPSLEPEASLLLAHQLTWADRAEEAVPWYRRHLERDPGDREARLGLARALSWSGRDEEARELYGELAAEDPTDAESRTGLARLAHWKGDDRTAVKRAREALAVDPENRDAARLLAAAENRRGRHRAAEAEYDALLAADPGDEEALVGRARARHWMGESASARGALADLESDGAVELRDAIDADRSRHREIAYSRFEDADDQEVEMRRAAVEISPSLQTSVRVEAREDIAGEPGTADVRIRRGSAGLAHRFDRTWAIHAYAGAGRITSEGDVAAGEGETLPEDEVERTVALYDAWVTCTPIDWTRFDVGAARLPIETPKSLARGILVDLASIGAHRRVHDRLAFDASASWSSYSDDNTRVAGTVSAEASPWNASPLTFVACASVVAFDRTVDHGYYDPENYDVLFVEGRYEQDVHPRLRLEAFARVSSERENHGERFGVGSGGIDATWRLARPLALTAFARKSTSRFDTSSGYEREGWGVAIRIAP